MSHGLRIAFFGSSLVSSWWNGAATYYRGLVRALHARGHHVTFYEPDAHGRQEHRDLQDPDWVRVVVFANDRGSLDACLDDAFGVDVVVKASGVGAFDAYLEARVLELRRSGTQVVFWDVDAPATLERVAKDANDLLRPLIPRFDHILTSGGGAPVVNAYRELGAKRCVPIPNAVDPDTHHPVAPEPRFAGDLSFLGHRLLDREARVEAFFFKAAEALPRSRMLLGGSGWEDRVVPANVARLGHVYTPDHNAVNCSARAVLNLHRDSMARFGFSPGPRVFEAAGAGACLITDAFEGVEQFLEPGREVLVAHSGEEVVEHLRRLTPEDARRMGQAALRRVLAEHTYAHRAARVEAELGYRAGAGRG
ncbi:glycosyltransferase [Corallococcus caeni]|uniref:CgeB family protein n=1 Tax=Corallococcus caeni TaxID=3082388 RepID=UPI0029580EF4|nr:glycosyltransferase [Corallococcus sp. KH5-1]